MSGKHVWRATGKIFDDRMKLASGGVVFLQVHIQGEGSNKRSRVEAVSRGFTEDPNELDYLEEASYLLEKDIDRQLETGDAKLLTREGIAKVARERFATSLYNETGKKPTVLPVVGVP